MRITNTKFSQNRAVNVGGEVTIAIKSKLIAVNCSFTENSAYVGGALAAFSSQYYIADSHFSHNIARDGGTAKLVDAFLIMTNSHLENNTAGADGGVIYVTRGTVIMSQCLVSNNTATGDGGVFTVEGGSTLLKNSSFVANDAGLSGGVLMAVQSAVIHVTECFYFGNRAKYSGGVLYTQKNTKILISDTNIIKNSAQQCGVFGVSTNSTLELNGSLVEHNYAKTTVGASCIFNNSLFVAINSSFKGNRAYEGSTIHIFNSTVYLEKCIFMENQMTYFGGTISIFWPVAKLKISKTVFKQNEGYDILHITIETNFTNKIETYKCLFVCDNISLKSKVKNFEEVAVKEMVIGQYPILKVSLNQEKHHMPQVSCYTY